jgi:hypothetical protein
MVQCHQPFRCSGPGIFLRHHWFCGGCETPPFPLGYHCPR